MGYFGSTNVWGGTDSAPLNISGLANDKWLQIGTLIHQPIMNIFTRKKVHIYDAIFDDY